jgi:hypothetical protein
MVKKVFKPIIFDIFRKKEQIATARTNSHGQAQVATACGGPLLADYLRNSHYKPQPMDFVQLAARQVRESLLPTVTVQYVHSFLL